MRTLDKQQLFKEAGKFFLPVTLIAGIIIAYVAHNEASLRESLLKRRQSVHVDFVAKSTELELQSILQDLVNLSHQAGLQDYLADFSEDYRRKLEAEYFAFIRNNRKYDQVRLLLLSGMEDIRVNKQRRGAAVVSRKSLQDKASRYYFVESKDLPPNNVFVSEMDLNVENGKLETPIKPMVRVATPCFDAKGDRKGVLMLNYLAQGLLDTIARSSELERSHTMLLNKNGYWLYSPHPEDAWAFMYPERQNRTFASRYPEAWSNIRDTLNGQFMHEGALFTFSTVHFLPPHDAQIALTSPIAWKLVSIVAPEQISLLIGTIYNRFLYVFTVITLLIGTAAFLNARRLLEKAASLKAIQQSQSRFKQIVDSSWDIIWEADQQGRITYVSPRVHDILGFTQEEVLGRSPFTVDSLLSAVQGGAPLQALPEHFHWDEAAAHREGHTVWLHTTGNPVFDDSGSLTGIRGISRDVTDRILNDRELENARMQAETANMAKSEFLARMSHEIRTPMNAILGMTYLALRTELTPKQQDYLLKIKQSANSLLGIINDILDFSKIEAGRLEVDPSPFSLHAVMENTVNIVCLPAEEKGIELLLAVDSDVPAGLYGDSLRLGQVLINLANNAIKFTEEGEVVVSVSVENRTPEGGNLRFSVRDTGIGLSQEHMAQLYTPFTQADGSTTRLYGGTGLGLSISKKLVELMGGELNCQSTQGLGSEFHFTLHFPLADVQHKQPMAPQTLRKCRILVVDDNATARQIMRDILASFGLRADLASGGSEALEAVQHAEPPFDLVLIDWKMPDMDGFACIRAIREMPNVQRLPRFIMITAYGRDEVRHRVKTEKLDGMLLKPVNRSLLFNTLVDVLSTACDGNTQGQAPGQEAQISHSAAEPVNGTIASARYDMAEECATGGGTFAPRVPQHIRGARILLVEDNELNQQVATELLQGSGLHVTLARNGQEALDRVRRQEFQAVLMDVQMPVMDGLEATRLIREIPSLQGLPIIAMTAHAMNTDREMSLQTGMNAHVNKPIDPDELLAVLGRWIASGGWEPVSGTARTGMPDDAGGESAQAASKETTVPPYGDEIAMAEGLRRVRGNAALYTRLLSDFLRENANVTERILHCLNHESRDTAFRLAHTLKGVAGNIGAMQVHEAAAALADAIKQRRQDIPPLLTEVESTIRRAEMAATHILESFTAAGSATAAQADNSAADSGEQAPARDAAPKATTSGSAQKAPTPNTPKKPSTHGGPEASTSAAVTGGLESSEFAMAVRELAQHIATHDMNSLTLFETLRTALEQRDKAETERLGQELAAFAFKKAGLRLAALTTMTREGGAQKEEEEEDVPAEKQKP
ncbi:response regulator [Desulfovibrio psychrotolerans]|uniref:Sensory/regulatory protein RpfC n=1 Tax=Desulfovibrio psychrotolerans TaxID=415242 RepID=A0A7J0BWQ5_9BACT|nr:response regulator [Desulfovibrio psychrotolerans]GFM37404.1 hypothetical protein DSM19430T_20880 [Desulfovibrio psychrotolerans]